MGQEGIMLSEINQTEKDKYHMILFTRGILKPKQINKQNENRLKDRVNKWVLPEGRGLVKSVK